MKKITPVILSGGTGTRLWPISRSMHPKQVQPVFSEKSLLQETVARVYGNDFSAPIIVCNNNLRFIVAEQLRAVNISAPEIILEPTPKNTAPAITLAALKVAENNPQAIMLVLPSDHTVSDHGAFMKACANAANAAEAGYLVTFGIQPDGPNTGYGYIKKGKALADHPDCLCVAAFAEKPDMETAGAYVASGEYLWNSGMFAFKAEVYLSELSKHEPDVLKACKQAVKDGQNDLDFFRVEKDAFETAPSISIDYAVMEHTKNAVVVPVEMKWSDIGTWSQLWKVSEKDADGNAIKGDVFKIDTQNTLIHSTGAAVGAIGLEDMIVVVDDDAVLVAPMNRAEDVSAIVAKLKASARPEHLTHRRVYRPWGWYQTVDSGTGFVVKQLMVKPGGILSLQSHQHRAEHWVVVSGTASITKDDETFDLVTNRSTFIAPGTRHRLENGGDEPLHIIEVQTGAIIEEADIERLEDDYGRK